VRRRIPGLSSAEHAHNDLLDGAYLVRVERVQYHWQKQKPFYTVHYTVLAPSPFAGKSIRTRLYASVNALWKLNWFLKDFGYDPDLLGSDELDELAIKGLEGVIKISHRTVNGCAWLNVDAFGPAEDWGQPFERACDEAADRTEVI
jgi:hypothetical protein